MITRVRSALASPERDEGMSMAELSVSMVVFVLLLTAVLLITVSVQRLYVQDTASEDNLAEARHAMDLAVKDLRGTQRNRISGIDLGFSETTGTAVTFYVPGATSGLARVRIYRDGNGVLWRQTTQPDTSSVDPVYTYTANLGQRSERLANGVAASTSGTPIFSYVVGGAVSTSVTTDADRAVITAVVVTLTANTASGSGAAPVTLVNTVNPVGL